MGSKANTWENGLLDLLFLNTAFTTVGDAGGLLPSATAGSLYFALHTADPGETATQTTSECSYGAYARVAVARSGAGFSRTNNQITNVANIDFPEATSGTQTATHWTVGTASSGTGKVLYYGDLSPTIAIVTGVVPRIKASTLNITEE